MRRRPPPRVANWLLGRLLPERDREVVMGDLVEEYALRARSASRVTVSHWYWGQVCRSIPRIVWRSARRGHWLPTLSVAMGAYIAAGMIEFAGDAAISKLVAPESPMLAVVGMIIGLATMALGGYLAAWVRPGASTALAWIVMISVAVMMVTQKPNAPLWYQIAFLIFGPCVSWGGGTLMKRRQT
jgi:hypothetical protein